MMSPLKIMTDMQELISITSGPEVTCTHLDLILGQGPIPESKWLIKG